MKALDAIKARPEYSSLKISYGKDRCANPPRANSHAPGGGGSGRNRHVSGGEGGTTPVAGGGQQPTTPPIKQEDEADAAELEAAIRASGLDKVEEE